MKAAVWSHRLRRRGVGLEVEDILELDGIVHIHRDPEAHHRGWQTRKPLELREQVALHLRTDGRVQAEYETLRHHLLLLSAPGPLDKHALHRVPRLDTAAGHRAR